MDWNLTYTKKNRKDNYMKMGTGTKIVFHSKLKLWNLSEVIVNVNDLYRLHGHPVYNTNEYLKRGHCFANWITNFKSTNFYRANLIYTCTCTRVFDMFWSMGQNGSIMVSVCTIRKTVNNAVSDNILIINCATGPKRELCSAK